MNTWLRRLRAALGTGVLSAAGGAFAGFLMELVLNVVPGSDLFLGVDVWPAALAIPGFFAGAAFSMVLGEDRAREVVVNTWLRRLRGAIGMGLLWAAGGAFGGALIELILNVLPGSDLFLGVDMWPATLAIPGFLAGVAFSMVLGVMEGRRNFDELTLPRSALWGALVGLLLGVIIGLPFVAIGCTALISSASAAGSLAVARTAKRLELIGNGTTGL